MQDAQNSVKEIRFAEKLYTADKDMIAVCDDHAPTVPSPHLSQRAPAMQRLTAPALAD
jgi:hypothetical protein